MKKDTGIVALLTLGLAVAPCFGEDKKHIEQREYTPETEMTTIVSASTATVTHYNWFITE